MRGKATPMLLALITAIGVLSGMIPIASAFAKGLFDEVTILDLDTGEVMRTSDPDLLRFFLWDPQVGPSSQPMGIVKGYVLTRYAIDQLDGKSLIPVDLLHYYSVIDAYGSHGYVYYLGWPTVFTEYDHKWFAATTEAEATIQRVLADGSTPSSLLPAIGIASLASMVGAVGIALWLRGRFPGNQ